MPTNKNKFLGQVREMAGDFMKFANALTVPLAGGAGRLGAAMADFQRRDFEALAPALHALAAGRAADCRRFWVERTKGGSKDSDAAVALLWLLTFSPRQLRCQIGADDQQQADEARLIVQQILRLEGPLNRFVASILDVQRSAIVNKQTGSVCEILTRDKSGTHGSRPDLVLINELTHIGDEEFGQTLFDNADKVGHSVVMVATNAGFVPSWQHSWREIARTSDRWHFSALTEPAPWVSEADLEESRRRNPLHRFNRLWQGIWCSGSGDALAPGDIEAACTLSGPLHSPERGWLYVAGLDIGLVKDCTALVTIGKHVGYFEESTSAARPQLPRELSIMQDLGLLEDASAFPKDLAKFAVPAANYIRGTGRYRLCDVKVWQRRRGESKVDVEQVERAILATHRQLRLACVGFDPSQAQYLAERLHKQLVPMRQIDFVPSNLQSMAAVTMEAFEQRTIELYRHPALLADLQSLRAVEKGYGVRLESPRTTKGAGTVHGDAATGLAIALHVAKRLAHRPGGSVQGELVVYP